MKVAIYGATGMIGSRILRELSSRGHEVIAIARETLRKITSDAGRHSQVGRHSRH